MARPARKPHTAIDWVKKARIADPVANALTVNQG